MNEIYQVELHPAFAQLISNYNNKNIGTQTSPQQLNINKNNINISDLILSDVSPLPISSSVNPESYMTKQEHDAQPIKSIEDINSIVLYYLQKQKYRDAMLFVVGINFGLRVSDLRLIRFGDIINSNGSFRDELLIDEEKTGNRRHIYINDAVKLMVKLYLQNTAKNNTPKSLDDYLFVAEESNNKKYTFIEYISDNQIKTKKVQCPMSDSAIYPILKAATKELNIKGRFSTHAYRKTFAYHILMQVPTTELNNKPNERQLEFLQKVFGHSNSSTTLHYAGFTEEEIQRAYLNLNLGLEMLSSIL